MYNFKKPNDRSALDLMNAAAVETMKELPDIVLAYGMSDEFRYTLTASPNGANVLTWLCSFVFDRSCTLFDRREMYGSDI